MDTVTDSESLPVRMSKTEEGELSDFEQDTSLTEADQMLSEEQNYRETMSGVRSFMGWTHIPEVDSALSSSEDNPSQHQSNNQREKLVFIYQQTGCVAKWTGSI